MHTDVIGPEEVEKTGKDERVAKVLLAGEISTRDDSKGYLAI